jgi:hypothetical protein
MEVSRRLGLKMMNKGRVIIPVKFRSYDDWIDLLL